MRAIPAEPGFELVVLGAAQDGGVPHVGCFAPCCEEARRRGRRETPACLGIRDLGTGALVLVEATPAVESQLARLYARGDTARTKAAPVDALLITHAHIGHYLGLAHFGREVAGSRGLPLHVTPALARFLSQNGPWSQLVDLGQVDLREFTPGAMFEPLPGLRVEALPVPHRDEFSDTVAFRFTGPSQTVLFVPDVDSWKKHPGLLDRLLEGVDVAFLDGTFYDGRELPNRNLDEVSHPLMVHTMEALADRARSHPGSTRFIHLNHSNPALHDWALQEEIRGRGFGVARTGDTVPF